MLVVCPTNGRDAAGLDVRCDTLGGVEVEAALRVRFSRKWLDGIDTCGSSA
jgi:hypothetical protein